MPPGVKEGMGFPYFFGILPVPVQGQAQGVVSAVAAVLRDAERWRCRGEVVLPRGSLLRPAQGVGPRGWRTLMGVWGLFLGAVCACAEIWHQPACCSHSLRWLCPERFC